MTELKARLSLVERAGAMGLANAAPQDFAAKAGHPIHNGPSLSVRLQAGTNRWRSTNVNNLHLNFSLAA